jgi:hypothetical protein
MTNLTAEQALQQLLHRFDMLESRLTAPGVPAEGDLLAVEMQLRALRADAFPVDYFPDPMWSLLLDLYLASFTTDGRTEAELEQRLRLGSDRLQRLSARLIDDGYAQHKRDDFTGRSALALSRLGATTMQAVFARTQGRMAELRAAA